jgi:gallate decarboxylase subunit D
MKPLVLHEGAGRTKVSLSARSMGNDLIIRLFNSQAHIGAVALSEYNPAEKRASTSVLTRYGHRDDSIACMAAYRICRRLKKPVCTIAGIHLDNITKEEIDQIVINCETLVDFYLKKQSAQKRNRRL